MADVIAFPRRWCLAFRSDPGFTVKVLKHDGEWLVACRKHSWAFRSRSAAQAFARDVADSFGVLTVVHLRGAA